MAFTPDPGLFNKSFGGGLQNAKRIVDLVQNRNDRNTLQSVAQLAQQGDYNQAGSKLIGLGMVNPGSALMNVPYERQQDAFQSKLDGLKFQNLQNHRANSLAIQQQRIAQADRHHQQNYNKPTAAQSDFIYAKRNGYKGSFADWKKVANPGTTINMDSNFKVPSGYMRDPNNPAGVIPIPGGPQDPNTPTTQSRNNAIRVNNAAQALFQGLEAYGSLIDKYGTEVWPNKGKDALLAARRDLQLQAKELFNLGVLNGPDLTLMDEMIPDPTNLMNAGLDWVGWGDFRTRARANINQLTQQFDRLRSSQTPDGFKSNAQPVKSQPKLSGTTKNGIKWELK